MSSPFDDPDAQYLVVVNAEGQYALWPTFADVPAGFDDWALLASAVAADELQVVVRDGALLVPRLDRWQAADPEKADSVTAGYVTADSETADSEKAATDATAVLRERAGRLLRK